MDNYYPIYIEHIIEIQKDRLRKIVWLPAEETHRSKDTWGDYSIIDC